MTPDKNDLIRKIRQLESKIDSEKKELKELNLQYSDLEEFLTKIRQKELAFQESIKRRRKKLQGIDALLTYVKSAVAYKDEMNDLLYGSEYQNTAQGIGSLISTVGTQKSTVAKAIISREEELKRLKQKLKQMKEELSALQTEESENGD